MLIKLLSYLYPLTKRFKSEYSGELELTVINGRKVLDTKHVNYSYGSLQRVLNFSLDHVDFNHIDNVLVLGLGGGSVVRSLRENKNFKGTITGIDIDPVIIDIAAKEFEVVSDNATTIICADAWDFIQNDTGYYDLIIVDLFIDNVVPIKFLRNEFWRWILDRLNGNGEIIFNTLCNPASDIKPIKAKFDKRGIHYDVHRYVEKTNKVLIAHCG